MKVKMCTLHARADNVQSKTHGIQQTTTSDWKGVSLGLKACAHIKLLQEKLVAASSQNQNAQMHSCILNSSSYSQAFTTHIQIQEKDSASSQSF
jgi:hypothetical protein